MKIKLTIVALLAGVVLAFGQNSRVVSAYNSLGNYTADRQGEAESLNKAKEYIDGVTEAETLEKPKVWYYRGNIYYEIAISKNPIHANLSPNPAYEAALAYQKCLAINPKYEFAGEANKKMQICGNLMVNSGVGFYSEKKYAEALDVFEKWIKVAEDNKSFDTLAVRNAFLSAREGKNTEKAFFYVNKLITAKAGGSPAYIDLSNLYAAKGDTANAIKALQDAQAAYGKDINLIIAEVNFYLMMNDKVNAEKKLREAIAVDGKNYLLFFAAGAVYSDLGKAAEEKKDVETAKAQYTKAEENFNKALEIKPDYGDAWYNLGVVYINRGNTILDGYNVLNEQRKFKEADLEKVKWMDLFTKAIEYIEKARATVADPKKDGETADAYFTYLKALKELYSKVDNTDKYLEMKKLMDDFKN